METATLTPLAHSLAGWIDKFPGASLRTLTDLARDAGYHLYDNEHSLVFQLGELVSFGLAHPHVRPSGLEAPPDYNRGVDTLWLSLSPSPHDTVAAVLHPGASCSTPTDDCLHPGAPAISESVLGESSGSRKGGAR